MFRIVCDPSSRSTEVYLTEIVRSGSLMFVVCSVGVWQRNFESVVCVYGTTCWGLVPSLSYRPWRWLLRAETCSRVYSSRLRRTLPVMRVDAHDFVAHDQLLVPIVKAFVPKLLNVELPTYFPRLCLFDTTKSLALPSRICSQTHRTFWYSFLSSTPSAHRFRSVYSRRACSL